MTSEQTARSETPICAPHYLVPSVNQARTLDALINAIPEPDTLVMPSTPTLEHHVEDILEAVEEIHNLSATLRVIPPDDTNRDEYEGRLYAALTHLDHHVKPAIKEWDRIVDRMPEE